MGGSQLLIAAGARPFEELALQGQALAILWCLVGPLSFIKSRIGGNIADLGLIIYGLVEVAGAGAARLEYGAGDLDPLVNAIAVQGIVGLSWLYSLSNDEDMRDVHNASRWIRPASWHRYVQVQHV